jgi:hypothetical protein
MELGYEFRWPPFEQPVIVLPGGKEIRLAVENYIPILESTAYTCGPKAVRRKATAQFTLAASSSRASGSGGPGPQTSTHPLAGPAPLKRAEGRPVSLLFSGRGAHEPAIPPATLSLSWEKGIRVGRLRGAGVIMPVMFVLSIEHLFTHFPKHPDCPACQRARLRRRPVGRTGTPHRATGSIRGCGNYGPHRPAAIRPP